MKIVKMSLAAAVLVGASAFAVDNVKVSGNAQVFYSTNTNKTGNYNGTLATHDATLFSKNSSAADAGLNLNVSADLAKNSLVTVSSGAGYTALSTLGLENNFVSNVWGSSHGATTGTNASYPGAFSGVKVENASWVNEAWIAVTAGKTTLKVGRMALDTPLAFTETWSIEKNTFEGAAVINTDIPDTTLVGAYVGNGNGTEKYGQDVNGTVFGNNLAVGAVVNQNGQFTTYGTNGAYAVGAINNSWKPLTVQAWYYDVTRLAQAYWLQADLNVNGILVGGQYVSEKEDKTAAGADTKADTVYAVMLGYDIKDLLTAKVSYSAVNKDGTLGEAGQNTATQSGASKLYTEAWWSYGYVTQQDTKSYNVTITSPVAGLFDLGVYYTKADQSTTAGNKDMTEFTVTAGKSFGPLDATLAYSNINAKNQNLDASNTALSGSSYNQVQAYLNIK